MRRWFGSSGLVMLLCGAAPAVELPAHYIV